jgi:endoglucanase
MDENIHYRLLLAFLVVCCIGTCVSSQIFIDQLGYFPDEPKIVFLNQIADSFYIKDTETAIVVFQGPFQLFKDPDPGTGMTLYIGDFSGLTTTGIYQVEVPGVGESFPFAIDNSIYHSLFQKSLKGFYFQRCGMNLLTQYAGNYSHSICHTTDGIFHTSTGQTGYLPSTGGWHDAGDYGKYVVNAGISVGTLLMAYEYFPAYFQSDDLNIPESGNGVADILDEARYELDWLLKMQHSNGGVYHKLTRQQFAGFVMPQFDDAARYIYQISSTATADFAAMMARSGRIFRTIDTTFANQCLAAAQTAWQFLQANPNIVPPGGFSNPSGTNTGTYGDSDDRDERLWAAAEIFMATGDPQAHQYYQDHYNDKGLFTSAMSWPNVLSLAHLTYLFGNNSQVNQTIRDQLQNSLLTHCQSLVNKHNANGFYVLINPGEYYWGSNSQPLNSAILLIMGYQFFQNPLCKYAALDQLHYLLGVNAHAMTFITGVGTVSPMHPHHRPSAADGITEPVPGLLVGGPDQNLSDPVLQAHFNSFTPPALCYIDDQGSYASNEICINWNAPLVFVAGYFNGQKYTLIEDSRQGYLPQEIDLLQNFPNPFNQTTTIRLNLRTAQQVVLKIYDVQGRMISSADLGKLPAGKIEIPWTAENTSGTTLSSGIYYYYVESGTRSAVKKMVYIR